MSIDALVDGRFFGKYAADGDGLCVDAVFSAGAYMTVSRGGLVMLHDASLGTAPFGVGVENAAAVIKDSGMARGQRGRVSGGALILPESGLRFRLMPAPPGDEPELSPTADMLRAAAERGEAALKTSGRGSLSELLSDDGAEVKNRFAKAALEPVRLLKKALRLNDGAGMRAALADLLGLGEGLTPSMDDFLCALCAVLLRAQRVWGLAVPEASALAEALRELAPLRTSPISAAYLISYASGEEASRLAEALRPGPELMSPGAAAALLGVGGGSGADMLCGAVFGLRYLMERFITGRV